MNERIKSIKINYNIINVLSDTGVECVFIFGRYGIDILTNINDLNDAENVPFSVNSSGPRGELFDVILTNGWMYEREGFNSWLIADSCGIVEMRLYHRDRFTNLKFTVGTTTFCSDKKTDLSIIDEI